VNITNLHIS